MDDEEPTRTKPKKFIDDQDRSSFLLKMFFQKYIKNA